MLRADGGVPVRRVLPRSSALLPWLATASLVLAGCDTSAPQGERDKALAKALDASPTGKDPKAAEERMKKLKQKAEDDARKAHDDALQKLTDLPATLPADLATGCTEVGRALEDFKEKRLTGPDLDRWMATKQPDMRRAVEACAATGSIALAACEANALHNAPVSEFTDGMLTELLQVCLERHAPPAQPE